MDKFEELDGIPVNPSTEPTIGEVISRRTMLKGMAATSAFGLFGCGTHERRQQFRPGIHRGATLERRGDPGAAGL